MNRQASLRASLLNQGQEPFVVERAAPVDRFVECILRISGLESRGRSNCLDVRVVKREQPLARLPTAFDGLRLLHLSDLHLDLIPGFADVVIGLIERTPHDLAVITGDFADHPAGYFHDCLEGLRRIARTLGPGTLAVLGNHDIIEIVPHLENAGIRVLLNENARIDRGDRSIWIAGIDDPHFYRTHDLTAACKGIPQDECAILLSHSPKMHEEARQSGFDLMLSGHTHGGQICLPGGIAIVRNERCPAELFAGAWIRGTLCGYTSRGTGSCGVAARFNCPPEITLHVLRAA